MADKRPVETFRIEDLELMDMLFEQAEKKSLTVLLGLLAELNRDQMASRMPGFRLEIRKTSIRRKKISRLDQAILLWYDALYALCVSATRYGRRDARLYLSVLGRCPSDAIVQAVAYWLRDSGCTVRLKDRLSDSRLITVNYK
ncbi:MAG: hypothetical protein WCT10_03335 [Patescibacteria group bacterium]|jgi:hypothetical protein